MVMEPWWQGDKSIKCHVNLSFRLLRRVLLRPKRLSVTGYNWHLQFSKKKWFKEDGRPGRSPAGSPKALGSCKMATDSYRNQIVHPLKDTLFEDVVFGLKTTSTSFFSPRPSGGYALKYIPGCRVLTSLEWELDKSMPWHLPLLSNFYFSLCKMCMVEGKTAACLSLAFIDSQESIRAKAAEHRYLEVFPSPLERHNQQDQKLN